MALVISLTELGCALLGASIEPNGSISGPDLDWIEFMHHLTWPQPARRPFLVSKFTSLTRCNSWSSEISSHDPPHFYNSQHSNDTQRVIFKSYNLSRFPFRSPNLDLLVEEITR